MDDEVRTHGIEFGDLETALREVTYPIRARELVARYGDREVRLVDGRVRIDEVLDAHVACDATYESPAAVRQAVGSLVGRSAVGRAAYSDRGAPALNDRHDSL